jgi:transcriptional regulator GlxA family with amidase domain
LIHVVVLYYLDDIAGYAATSTHAEPTLPQPDRSTPLQWLLAARIGQARILFETTALSVEWIATATGFGSATAMRARFAQTLGTSPLRYRQAFRQSQG